MTKYVYIMFFSIYVLSGYSQNTKNGTRNGIYTFRGATVTFYGNPDKTIKINPETLLNEEIYYTNILKSAYISGGKLKRCVLANDVEYKVSDSILLKPAHKSTSAEEHIRQMNAYTLSIENHNAVFTSRYNEDTELTMVLTKFNNR